MEFGWDPAKHASNLAKHQIDFIDVTLCFDDPNRRVWRDARFAYGEERFNMLALLGSRLMHITFTARGEVVRLISARKANDREQRTYAQHRQQ